jgi:hypothetical protein
MEISPKLGRAPGSTRYAGGGQMPSWLVAHALCLPQKLKEALDIKSHEAELLATRLQQCEHSRMIEEIEAAKEQVIQSREALRAAAQKEADADAKAKQIETAMNKSSGTVPPLYSHFTSAIQANGLSAHRSKPKGRDESNPREDGDHEGFAGRRHEVDQTAR